jgi:hypothetical protein
MRFRWFVLGGLFALSGLIAAGTWVGFEGSFCRRCGVRVERADVHGTPIATIRYRCRLGFWFASDPGSFETCAHRDLFLRESGGWEQFLAYCGLCDRYND